MTECSMRSFFKFQNFATVINNSIVQTQTIGRIYSTCRIFCRRALSHPRKHGATHLSWRRISRTKLPRSSRWCEFWNEHHDFSCDFCQNVSKLQIFTRYQLFGVSNHSGSLAYGHYTAYVRDTEIGADPGVWHDYNDSYVRKLDDPANTVCSNNAYLLFYRRIAPEDEATLVTPSPSAELI